jgi:hypothetical protein
MTRVILIALPLAIMSSVALAEWQELSDLLIQYTYKIEGQSATPGKNTCGTVFLVGKPYHDNTNNLAQPVMVTAAHVLKGAHPKF